MKYRTVWVSQWVSNSDPLTECTEVDKVINAAAADGWSLHSITPGTNAQTYSGLFVTLQRQS